MKVTDLEIGRIYVREDYPIENFKRTYIIFMYGGDLNKDVNHIINRGGNVKEYTKCCGDGDTFREAKTQEIMEMFMRIPDLSEKIKDVLDEDIKSGDFCIRTRDGGGGSYKKGRIFRTSKIETDSVTGVIEEGTNIQHFMDSVRKVTKNEIDAYKLPNINGFRGYYCPDSKSIVYGCCFLPQEIFSTRGTRFIDSLVLNSEVEITSHEVQQIRNYLILNNINLN